MRFMAIDYGTKRIGLAVGDDVTRLATPLEVIDATGRIDDDVRAVIEHANDYGVGAFVIGLPLNMDDSEGPQARTTRRFGDALARKTSLTVHYHDERLSTRTADDLLQPVDLTRKKKKQRADAVAAQVILQSYFDALPLS